jgi:hypothetical protein
MRTILSPGRIPARAAGDPGNTFRIEMGTGSPSPYIKYTIIIMRFSFSLVKAAKSCQFHDEMVSCSGILREKSGEKRFFDGAIQ